MKTKILSLIIITQLAACNSSDDFSEDFQHIRVYQDDQAISCDNNSAISVKTHGALLLDQGIEIHCSQKGADGLSYPEACGSETGSINIFTIHKGDLDKATELGFSRVANLTSPQLDTMCEYKVISDHRKYKLLHQLSHAYDEWKSTDAASYKFQYQKTFSDCPTFAPLPRVEITVANDTIATIYDLTNDVFLTEFDGYPTIESLFEDIQLSLLLTPIEAGLSVDEPYLSPLYDATGTPLKYYINEGTEQCDGINYDLSDVEIISTNTAM